MLPVLRTGINPFTSQSSLVRVQCTTLTGSPLLFLQSALPTDRSSQRESHVLHKGSATTEDLWLPRASSNSGLTGKPVPPRLSSQLQGVHTVFLTLTTPQHLVPLWDAAEEVCSLSALSLPILSEFHQHVPLP